MFFFFCSIQSLAVASGKLCNYFSQKKSICNSLRSTKTIFGTFFGGHSTGTGYAISWCYWLWWRRENFIFTKALLCDWIHGDERKKKFLRRRKFIEIPEKDLNERNLFWLSMFRFNVRRRNLVFQRNKFASRFQSQTRTGVYFDENIFLI